MIHIGIDPGTHTGIAVWDSLKREFVLIDTMPIHKALEYINTFYRDNNGLFNIVVWFEDARQRTWYGYDSNEKIQGAGSIKRDCSIWEDFLKDKKIAFHAIPPQRGGTKMKPESFKNLTGWEKRTSNHARDAAMIVFGR